ncbi:MAG TPA: hypothetical protein VJU79_05975 [Candidatus Dormibacteraeota bacterium]|nr:hypothetical protein [Candidatus Dormibacteraeota bacterium]
MRLPRRGTHALAVLLPVVSLVSACLHQPHTSPAVADDADSRVELQIANHNWSDMVIYVIRDGQPSRIGVATAASSASFMLPRRILGQGGEIRLYGRPIGGHGEAFSESVIVQPGQWVEWTLEDDLTRSAIGVY